MSANLRINLRKPVPLFPALGDRLTRRLVGIHHDTVRSEPQPFFLSRQLTINIKFSEHVPGTHMRIAHRDWDGSWKLLDPDTPFRPSGVSEVSPSPSSSTFRFGDIPLSVESFSVTRGYDGYDYDVKDPPQGAPDFGDQVLDISHGGLQK
jgi:hypothetical protein